MKAYVIQRYKTEYETERENEVKRRRAIIFFSLFTLACAAGLVYVVTR